MEKWILSIVGIVALGVLIDIILPSGDMNKYIKGVFSIIVVCVIVAPLPKLFTNIKNKEILNHSVENKLNVDDDFVIEFNNKKLEEIASSIKEYLIKYGYNISDVSVIDKDNDKVIDKIIIYGNDDRKIEIMNKVLDVVKVKCEVEIVGSK